MKIILALRRLRQDDLKVKDNLSFRDLDSNKSINKTILYM